MVSGTVLASLLAPPLLSLCMSEDARLLILFTIIVLSVVNLGDHEILSLLMEVDLSFSLWHLFIVQWLKGVQDTRSCCTDVGGGAHRRWVNCVGPLVSSSSPPVTVFRCVSGWSRATTTGLGCFTDVVLRCWWGCFLVLFCAVDVYAASTDGVSDRGSREYVF